MESPITGLLNTTFGRGDSIVFTPVFYNEETGSILIRIDSIGNTHWEQYTPFQSGESYEFSKHGNSDEPPFKSADPMELWEWLRPGQKENETILPQVLLYFWHKDNRLSMELDW